MEEQKPVVRLTELVWRYADARASEAVAKGAKEKRKYAEMCEAAYREITAFDEGVVRLREERDQLKAMSTDIEQTVRAITRDEAADVVTPIVKERDQLRSDCRSWRGLAEARKAAALEGIAARDIAEGRLREIERLLNRVAELEAELNELKPNRVVDDIDDRLKAVNAEPGVRM